MAVGKDGDLEAIKKMIELKKKFVEKYGLRVRVRRLVWE